MKQLILNIKDDSKLDVFVKFLKEINFIEVEGVQSSDNIKVWGDIPYSMLNPIKVENFKMYSREELYDR